MKNRTAVFKYSIIGKTTFTENISRLVKGIADLITHTEGAQLFVGAHIHIGSLQIPILYGVHISFYYTYSIKKCNGK